MLQRHYKVIISFGLMLLYTSVLMGQRDRLQVGNLWDTAGGLASPLGLQGLYLVWPGGGEQSGSLYEGGFRTNSTGAMFRLLFKDFETQVLDSSGNVIETRTIPFYHPGWALKTDKLTYQPEIIKWMRTYRGPTTVIYEDGSEHVNLVEKQSRYVVAYPRLISDEMVEYTEFYNDGFYVKSKYYAWANPSHDDYIIRVIEIVNNGNLDDDIFTQEMEPKDLKNLYYDYYVNNFSPNNKGEGYYSYNATGSWDNWHDYYGDSDGDTLRFMYAFDGDDPDIPGDDRGDPFPEQYVDDRSINTMDLYNAGEFISAMYAGYGVLHVDQSSSVKSNDKYQPFTYGYGDFNLASGWREELRWLNIFNNGDRLFNHPDYTRNVPKEQEACWMGFGPFDLPAYGRLRIVLVHAVNGPSIEKCKEMGEKYLRGEITQEEKNAFLDSGLDSLALTIQRAQWNWDNYLSKNRMIPNAPAPPTDFKIASGIKKISLSWTESSSSDVVEYRIYRKAGSNLGDFERIGSVPASETVFIDSLLDLGVSYYYYVTSANDGSDNIDPTCYGKPLESSKFFNRSYHPAIAYREASNSLSQVRVVPNPFNLKQTTSWPGEADRLTFTNLTRRCEIRIFTVNGDLVKSFKKDNESAYYQWSPMLTDDNLLIAPDIYIYHVKDLETGETNVGKFIIVR